MMILFAMLVALSAFFACVGLLRLAPGLPWVSERRLVEGWASTRLRQQFRAGVQRARLRSIR